MIESKFVSGICNKLDNKAEIFLVKIENKTFWTLSSVKKFLVPEKYFWVSHNSDQSNWLSDIIHIINVAMDSKNLKVYQWMDKTPTCILVLYQKWVS